MTLKDTIFSLEQLLLHTDWSGQAEKLDSLLTDDFREINPAGTVVSRDDVIQWLQQKDPQCRWEIVPDDIIELGGDTVLSTYQARQVIPANPDSKGARHFSVWSRNGQGQWQLRFHQSTKILK